MPNEPTRDEILGQLRHDMAHVVFEPMHVEQSAAVPELIESPAPRQVPTGGYPIDYGWLEEAAFHQSQSGEGSQE